MNAETIIAACSSISRDTLVATIIVLIVSVFTLIYTVKIFRLKSGTYVRGCFSITSSITCEDKYVGSITLENLKDHSIVIFKIYLLVGRNYYIELEDFEENPLILNSFEVYSKKYDPVDFYTVNMSRIRLNNLMNFRKAKPCLVLSTTHGRYKVKEFIKEWRPYFDFFKNHLTATIKPVRLEYKGKSYGSNAKFIIDIKMMDNKEETIPIYAQDYRIRRFEKIQFTKESLESKENLEQFLLDKKNEGVLNCNAVAVYDIDTWRKSIYPSLMGDIEAKYYSWYKFNILGRLFTVLSNTEHKLKNRQ